ncbi:hypothetical protein DC487_05150 [Sphingobacterium corticibacter]|uniref:Uncharacterized protein n=1 Tax=Sphingobacterium corticibacter TaxID=2171749 RepID=A0A2T8HNJ7_9SPHI|nr:hypothetical protein DC487_05150 [Sphingobacterium corticibacter]
MLLITFYRLVIPVVFIVSNILNVLLVLVINSVKYIILVKPQLKKGCKGRKDIDISKGQFMSMSKKLIDMCL